MTSIIAGDIKTNTSIKMTDHRACRQKHVAADKRIGAKKELHQLGINRCCPFNDAPDRRL
jgi:hypothetical protein